MVKKITALVLSLCLVFAVTPVTAWAITDADKLAIIEGVMDTSWYTGNEDATEYHISTPAQLWGLAYYGMWQKYVSFAGKTVYLDADIDLTGFPEWMSMYTNLSNYPFRGTLDGNYHTISGFAGEALFGCLNGGVIRNLHIDGNPSGAPFADQIITGSLVENCIATGTAQGGGIVRATNTASTVRNCFALNTVTGSGGNLGGIVGNSMDKNSVIENCYALNYSITTTSSSNNIGRIYGGGVLGTPVTNNNYAYVDMLGTFSDAYAGKNGTDIDVYTINAEGFFGDWNINLPSYLIQPIIPDDKINQVSITVDPATFGGIFTTSAGFALSASFAADQVNLVEAQINYNPELFDVDASIALENAIVKMHKVDEEWGFVTFVIGVKNEGNIAYEDVMDIAKILLTPKDGLQPDYATAYLASVAAYSKGELVELEILNDYTSAALTYRSILDVNGDGKINAADLSLALYYFGVSEGDPNWDEARFADVNGDGTVDTIDITILINTIYGE